MNKRSFFISFLEAFQNKVFSFKQASYFRAGILGIVFLQLCYYCYNYSFFFSDSLIQAKPVSGYGIETFLHLLSHPLFQNKAFLFLIIAFFSFFLLLIHRIQNLAILLLWFSLTNLQNRTYYSLSGGNVLLCLVLFYLAFTCFRQDGNYYQRVLHNTALVALKTQVVFVYFFSALYKCLDQDWLSGNAMGYISLLPAYFLTDAQFLFTAPIIYKSATWFILGFQCLFPFFIFLKKTKLVFIWLGIAIHIVIALLLGLYLFSAVMIVCYLLFSENEVELKL